MSETCRRWHLESDPELSGSIWRDVIAADFVLARLGGVASVKLTFHELAKKVLTEENRPLSPSEIWQLATAKGYDTALKSEGKTPASTLYSVIFTDERDNPNSVFIKVGSRPYRYFLKDLAGGRKPEELEKAASAEPEVPEKYRYQESQLHPFLCYFVDQQFDGFAKTIRHGTSRRDAFGEWVHPDVIGVHYPLKEWHDEVFDLSATMGGVAVRLYSFELKKKLSFANLREAFFQAVSNSSWAHEGYLVAADISTDEDFVAELRRLSASFGIGIIKLDLEDPGSSTILVPARRRDPMDWDALNKLAMNKDVQTLLKRINKDLQTKEIRKEDYDKILGPEELIASIGRTKV